MRLRNLVLAVAAMTSVSISAGFCDNAKPVDYEKASMRYVLSYEALQKAKQDPTKTAEIPKRLKKYRESYAQYQKLLSENDLYNPADVKTRNDPAGNYNKKQQKEGKPKRKFKKVDISKARENVNQTLEAGGDLDNAIENVTNTTIPPAGNSSIDLADLNWDPSCEPPEGYTYDEWMKEIEYQLAAGMNEYSEEILNQYNQILESFKNPTTTPTSLEELSGNENNYGTMLDEVNQNTAAQAEDDVNTKTSTYEGDKIDDSNSKSTDGVLYGNQPAFQE